MFYVNDEPEGKVLDTDTIKLHCIVLYAWALQALILQHWSKCDVSIYIY